MKKIFLVIPMIAALVLTGCGAKEAADNGVTRGEYTNPQLQSSEQQNDVTQGDNGTTAAADNGVISDSQGAQGTGTVGTDSSDKFAYTIHDGVMDLDSDKGPYYIINLGNMTVADCTSTGAKVVSYTKDGDVLTITLYSDEYPVNSTYVVNLAQSESDEITAQTIENNVLKFSTQKGPDYAVDLGTLKLVSCSDNTGRVVKASKNGSTLTLIVYSDTLPVDMTYTFTIN